jgi:adenylylsulfate kinase-like enzyme
MLYQKARRGEVAEFTGISSPYEPPMQPDLELDTSMLDERDAVDRLVSLLEL